MSLHIKIFLASAVLLAAGYKLFDCIDYSLATVVIEQAKATSCMFTMVGIIVLFGWYKKKVALNEVPAEVSTDNIKQQKKVLYYMLAINFLNAIVLTITIDKSTTMMALMSLMVVIISPIIFRTMHDK